MCILKDFILFVAGFFIIIKGADLLTSGAEGIAKILRIPRLIIGLTIVSIATTSPEFTISTVASWMGSGGLAVGNAAGSCLANIGLILATAAIIRTIKFNPIVIKRELVFLICAVILVHLFMLDNLLSRRDGLLLCLFLVGFFTYICLRALKNRNVAPEKSPSHQNIKKESLKFLAGLLGVVLSSKYAIIPSGINIAHFFKVPEIVIGLSIVALGTSLPELITVLVASFKKMEELATGNVIGANILNLLWVLGVSSLINPLNIDAQTKLITMPLVLIVTFLVLVFSATRLCLTRNEGLVLLFIYCGYIFYIFKFAY